MNERFDVIVTILELIGTAAFAASGVLTAIKRRFDLFGVIIIGVTTAVGGGIMRDIVIGRKPVGKNNSWARYYYSDCGRFGRTSG